MGALPPAYIAGVVGGSVGFNLVFYAVRRVEPLATEKQLAWVLTLATCIIASVGSMVYVLPALYYGLRITELTQIDTFSLVLVGIFTAYLAWDLAFGQLFYRSTISWLTGYFHHTLYIGITLYAVVQRVPAILCLLFYNEVPTIILAVGSINKNWRSDALFMATFFATRIALHTVLLTKFYKHSPHRFIWVLMLLVFPMHLYCAIYTAKRCSIHNALHIRSSALDAQVGNCISNRQALRHYHPGHICARAKVKSSRNRAPIKRDIGWLQKELSKGNVPEYATNPYRSGAAKKTAGGVRVVLDELKWPLDADIDERFAKRIRAVRLAKFRRSDDARKRCAYFGISEKQFSEWSHRFSEAVLEEQIERMQPNFLIPLLIRSRVEGLDNYIVNQFFAYLEDSAPQLVKNIKYLREITDLRFPQEWAPGARKIQRRIIMHVGPTNSGKTYHALQRLQNTTLGVYCSPLRLLAHEVYSRMMSAGITCGLITGEDRRFPDYEALGINPKGYSSMGNPLTQIIACTIE
ncbi:RNA helicase, partial [Coemansia sp. RSA 2704]